MEIESHHNVFLLLYYYIIIIILLIQSQLNVPFLSYNFKYRSFLSAPAQHDTTAFKGNNSGICNELKS